MHFGCIGVVFGWGGFIIAGIINHFASKKENYLEALKQYWGIAKLINLICFAIDPALGLFLVVQMIFAYFMLF